MAFYGKSKPKAKGTSVRLTGLFPAKKRGLFVGSTEELDPVVATVKRAIKEQKGLVFFLWKNADVEEGQPQYTIYMDVSQDQEERPQSRAIREDRPTRKQAFPSEDPEDTDEVPF